MLPRTVVLVWMFHEDTCFICNCCVMFIVV
jgi:hypothetical protein